MRSIRKDEKANLYGVEILVGGEHKLDALTKIPTIVGAEARNAKLESGLAFVPLTRDEEYAVRVYNDSPDDVAVQSRIDGISMFAFSELRHPDKITVRGEEKDNPRRGEPRYSVLIIPAKSHFAIPGWHVNNAKSDRFLITSYAKSAAAQFRKTTDLGMITVAFQEVVKKQRSVDGSGDLTGRGKRVDQKYEETQVNLGQSSMSSACGTRFRRNDRGDERTRSGVGAWDWDRSTRLLGEKAMARIVYIALGLLPAVMPMAARAQAPGKVAAALELVVQTGHTTSVESVSLSSDGKRLATGSWDKTAILWNAETGEKIRVFAGHTTSVQSVSLSSDGKRLATGSLDKTAILWNAETGEKIRVFAGHTNFVSSVSLSSDGKRLATGSLDKTAILWNAETGEKIRVFAGHTTSVQSVSLSSDGKRLATGSWDNTAILWNAETGEKIRVFAGHTTSVQSVSLSSDGKRLATGYSDSTAILWNAETGEKIRVFAGHTNYVYSVSLSSDGKRLATGSLDKTAILWNAEPGEKIRVFTGHTNYVTSVSLSSDGKRLATGSSDKTAILWNAETGEKIRVFTGHTNYVYSVSLSSDGKRLATGSLDKTAILWNAETGEKIRVFAGHTTSVESESEKRRQTTRYGIT